MRRRWMVAAGAAALWAGGWLVGAQGLKAGAEAWLAAERAGGRTARAEALAVTGFPAWFRIEAASLERADPAAGTAWRGTGVRLSIPAFAPWRVQGTLSGPLEAAFPGGRLTITAQDLRAGAAVTPLPDLPLARTEVTGRDVRLDRPGLVIGSLDLATERDGDAARHRVRLDLRDAALPVVTGTLAGEGFPPLVARIDGEARVSFTAPLDRHAGGTRPAVRGLDLNAFRLEWGDLVLTAAGSLQADAAGLAEGRMTLGVDNWPRAIRLAVALGVLHPDAAPTWERMGAALAGPGSTRVDLPLVFGGGRMSLGPLPLGPAPRMIAP